MIENRSSRRSSGFRAVTLGFAVVAVALHLSNWNAPFLYVRTEILRGEIWRAWTGHLVHFGASHLAWNLCVFVPAGLWLEILRPRATRFFYLLAPPFISAVLLLADPSLQTYAGLSGLATGLLVALAVLQLGRTGTLPSWFWWAVLALTAAKIGAEVFSGKPIFVSGFDHIRDVPLAHCAGAAAGFLTGWRARGPRVERHAA